MKSICITGVGGYLGLATAYSLIATGHRVIGMGSSSERPVGLPEGVFYASIDICDQSALAAFFKEYQVDTVYHFAAIKYVGKCEADPELCYRINTAGTETVLAAMQEASVRNIVYASTYAVYDWSNDQSVLREESTTEPKTIYGKSKLMSEIKIIDYANQGLIERYNIFRYANIVGAIPELPTHVPQSFLDKIVLASKTGDTININGDTYNTKDGTVARDFVDISDVVKAHLLVLNQTTSTILNISSGTATTLKQLIIYCENLTGRQMSILINPKTGDEPSSITIDSQKASQILDWHPTITTEQTIRLLQQKLVA